MKDIKEIVVNNLINLRKNAKLTQIELAEKIGYSDKSVSRWEHGEVMPDIETLYKLSLVYDVPVAVLFEETVDIKKEQRSQKQSTNKLIIALLSIISIWIIATAVFTCLKTFFGLVAWEIFILAVPCSFLLGIIFSALWSGKKVLFICISAFVWTIITYFFLQFIQFKMWLLFVMGVPMQIAILLIYNLHSNKSKLHK